MNHYYDTCMTKIQQTEQKIEKIKQLLLKTGNMRPGSLSIQSRSWGGEYYHLSYTHRGKGHTEYVRKKDVKSVEKQVANYRKFRELTQEWVDMEIELCKLKAERAEGK